MTGETAHGSGGDLLRASGELYRKLVERHTEQAYPQEQIALLLSDVGLHIEAHYDCFAFGEPGAETLRIMWVARRPAQTGDHV